MRVGGKGVVVTGGAQGIGRALAERFAGEGASYVAVLDIDEAGAERVAKGIEGLACFCDVAHRSSLEDAITAVERDAGPIEVFCSNAGITGTAAAGLDVDDATWDRMLRVNTLSHVWAAQRLVPTMIGRGGGWFVQTISAAGLITGPSPVAYTVTKHGALGFAEWLAMNYRAHGIGVSCICPTAVDTPMFAAPSGTDASANIKATIGQLMSPDELAGIVVDGLADERFLILNEDKVAASFLRKAQDYDLWMAGQVRRNERMKRGEAKTS